MKKSTKNHGFNLCMAVYQFLLDTYGKNDGITILWSARFDAFHFGAKPINSALFAKG